LSSISERAVSGASPCTPLKRLDSSTLRAEYSSSSAVAVEDSSWLSSLM
jgi:hypothetical protein